MTEAEWLTCDKPGPMRGVIGRGASDRKFRLFGCACYLHLWHTVPVPMLYREVLLACEDYAERRITKQAFKLARKRLPAWTGPHVSSEAWEMARISSINCCGERLRPAAGGDVWAGATYERPGEAAAQSAFIRCIFGNPFRPVAFSPEWRTDTAVILARQMYDAREFSAMPILADALQDSGCDSDDILAHCRDTSLTHVRGCWVCDLVLGKE